MISFSILHHTSCREATVRKQEIDSKRNPRELKEGLFVNDYVGSVVQETNPLNIPGATRYR